MSRQNKNKISKFLRRRRTLQVFCTVKDITSNGSWRASVHILIGLITPVECVKIVISTNIIARGSKRLQAKSNLSNVKPF